MNILEKKRFSKNNWAFIISYAFMGLMSGVAFDVLVTFLQMVSKTTAESFSSFMGLSTFVCAAILLLVPKLGYKKIIIAGPVVVIIALLSISAVNAQWIFPVATLAIMVGVTLFDVVLPPYLTAYTDEKNRNSIFSKAMYINVFGMVIATFFGGSLSVWRLSDRLNIGYDAASKLTEAVDKMSQAQTHQYMLAQRDVLLMFVVVALLSLIPLLFIKERRVDYVEEAKVEGATTKQKFDFSIFKNKYVVIWLVYFALIRFGASLITPYFSVFLNSGLGISRGVTSQLVSYQYFAMMLFLIISPYVAKKLGNVVSLGGLALLTIPFMIMIAQGKAFGEGMVFMVGLALFMRSGLMNCSNPIMNSLPMSFVPKNMRPAYNSLIFVAGGLTSILAGAFTSGFLFKLPDGQGYSIAYYITGIIYTVASVLLLVVYKKKYNRPEEVEEDAVTKETVELNEVEDLHDEL